MRSILAGILLVGSVSAFAEQVKTSCISDSLNSEGTYSSKAEDLINKLVKKNQDAGFPVLVSVTTINDNESRNLIFCAVSKL